MPEQWTEIAQICKDYNLTQTALAKRFGIPLRTVQDWYANRRVPAGYVVRMMIELLNHGKAE